MTPEQLSKSGSEHGHQRAFFAALRQWSTAVDDMTFAIPNGGARGGDQKTAAIRGANLKAEGVKAGVPDVLVAWPMHTPAGTYAGLFVEMKRPADKEKDRRAGIVGSKQAPWHDRLRARGYAVATAYSWEEALNAVKAYFGVTSREV